MSNLQGIGIRQRLSARSRNKSKIPRTLPQTTVPLPPQTMSGSRAVCYSMQINTSCTVTASGQSSMFFVANGVSELAESTLPQPPMTPPQRAAIISDFQPLTPPPCEYQSQLGARVPSSLSSIPDPFQINDELLEDLSEVKKEKRELQVEKKHLLAECSKVSSENRSLRRQVCNLSEELESQAICHAGEMDEMRQILADSIKDGSIKGGQLEWLEMRINDTDHLLLMQLQEADRFKVQTNKELKYIAVEAETRRSEMERELEAMKEALIQKDRELSELKAGGVVSGLHKSKTFGKGRVAEESTY